MEHADDCDGNCEGVPIELDPRTIFEGGMFLATVNAHYRSQGITDQVLKEQTLDDEHVMECVIRTQDTWDNAGDDGISLIPFPAISLRRMAEEVLLARMQAGAEATVTEAYENLPPLDQVTAYVNGEPYDQDADQ